MGKLLNGTLLMALCVGLGAGAAAQAPGGPPQGRRGPAPAPKNLQVFPKDTTRAELIPKMRVIAESLGVKCSFCHVDGDFAADTNDHKLIARKMLRMVDSINKDNFDDRPEVACYTCHRGAMKPVSQVPASDEKPGPGGRGGGK